LHQVSDLFELNVKLQCQNLKQGTFKKPTEKFLWYYNNTSFTGSNGCITQYWHTFVFHFCIYSTSSE